jgi:hypothetical protein
VPADVSGEFTAVTGLSGNWVRPVRFYAQVTAAGVPVSWSVDSSVPAAFSPYPLTWQSSIPIGPIARLSDSSSLALLQNWIVIYAVVFGIAGALLAGILLEWLRRPRADDATPDGHPQLGPGTAMAAMPAQCRPAVPVRARWLALAGSVIVIGYARSGLFVAGAGHGGEHGAGSGNSPAALPTGKVPGWSISGFVLEAAGLSDPGHGPDHALKLRRGGSGGSMTDEKVAVVQFPHPGGEHDPGEADVMEWNDAGHRRKFMRAAGRYVDDSGVLRTGTVTFWGEWEAQSRVVRRYPRSGAGMPRFLHEPFLQRPGDLRALRQNTDPLVFGDAFLYSNCRQFTLALRPSAMQRMAPGSVVLFGSTLDQRFVLDTVLVVACAMPYVIGEPGVFGDEVPELFIAAVLEPLAASRKLSGAQARLYRGAMCGESSDAMYSFVPARPDGAPFPRPVIELPGYVNPLSTQSARSTPVTSRQARQVWDQVTDQVRDQGLHLAFRLTEPEIRARRGSRADGHGRSPCGAAEGEPVDQVAEGGCDGRRGDRDHGACGHAAANGGSHAGKPGRDTGRAEALDTERVYRGDCCGRSD